MKGLTKKHIIRTLIFALLTGFLIAGDQIVKTLVKTNIGYSYDSVTVIPNFFEIVHWHNDGGMWGLFPGKVFILGIIACVASVILLFLASCSKPGASQLSLFLIMAGAVGNVIDRFKYGYVIDFLSFDFWGWKFPAFNIADSCVVIGALLLLVYVIFFSKDDAEFFIEGSPMNVLARKAKEKRAIKTVEKDKQENKQENESDDTEG